MANILEDVKDYGLNLFEDAKDWAIETGKDLYVDKVMGDYVDSFKDAFVTHDKLTPELEKQGWKLGIDGQPYNAQLAVDFAPGGKFYDPDVDRNLAMAQAAQDAGIASTPTTASPFLYQDLRQRTPSGTIYNPSMESFENASLFDYQGPGGLAEYTYGQGLPMGYGTYGTPVGPNLYYEGQFGEGFVEPGVADSAINLPPVTMPGDVPQIPVGGGSGSGGSGTGRGGRDLTYAETLAEMGIDPLDAPRTTFPSPGAKLVDTPASVLNVGMPDFLSDAWTGLKDFGSDLVGSLLADDAITETAASPSMDASLLVSRADQGPDVGLLDYNNDGTVSAADQAMFDAAKASREASRGSGIKYVDMGNNPDVGNLYTDPADRQLANEILGGEAYARAVYENSPAAQAVPGMADKDIAAFNLGRPEKQLSYKAQKQLDEMPSIFKVSEPTTYSEPGGIFTGGKVYAQQASKGPIIDESKTIYATQDSRTNEVVTVNPVTNTVTHTGLYGPPNIRF